MANKSTNINKTNNQLSSQLQQIHQHQQDEQSASHLNSNKSTNTNKTNNQLSSQLQQIHQHQQDEQSALISTR
jgi:hypothetical protein